jgi:hypothetical protein
VDLKTLQSFIGAATISYSHSAPIEKIFQKLLQLGAGVISGEQSESLQNFQDWMTKTDYTVSSIVPYNWQTAPLALLESLPLESCFPLLNILQLASQNAEIAKLLTAATLKPFMTRLSVVLFENVEEPTLLMTLKLVCNLNLGISAIDLLVFSLVCDKPALNQVGAVIAFNLALQTTLIGGTVRGGGEWVVELVAALCAVVEAHVGAPSTGESGIDLK